MVSVCISCASVAQTHDSDNPDSQKHPANVDGMKLNSVGPAVQGPGRIGVLLWVVLKGSSWLVRTEYEQRRTNAAQNRPRAWVWILV